MEVQSCDDIPETRLLSPYLLTGGDAPVRVALRTSYDFLPVNHKLCSRYIMTDFKKPTDLEGRVWAASGAIVTQIPPDILGGWEVGEKPPAQFFLITGRIGQIIYCPT